METKGNSSAFCEETVPFGTVLVRQTFVGRRSRQRGRFATSAEKRARCARRAVGVRAPVEVHTTRARRACRLTGTSAGACFRSGRMTDVARASGGDAIPLTMTRTRARGSSDDLDAGDAHLRKRARTSTPLEFTVDWFSHTERSLYRLFRTLGLADADQPRPRRVLEVGCWEGRGTVWLLANLCRHPESTLTCVDTWDGGEQYRDVGLRLDREKHSPAAVEARFDDNVRRVTGVAPLDAALAEIDVSGVAGKVRKMKGRSAEMLSRLRARPGGERFDVAYVDGSHAARDVMIDAAIGWELLRRGGVIVFHDYRWDRVARHVPRARCPRIAVDAFLEMFADEMIVLERDYICVAQKIV